MPLDRRTLIAGAAGVGLVATVVLLARKPTAAATVVYLGARDCPTCRRFDAKYKDEYRKHLAAHDIAFREVIVDTFHDNRQASAWPADLTWLREGLKSEIGTPWFFLILDHRIIAKTQYAS